MRTETEATRWGWRADRHRHRRVRRSGPGRCGRRAAIAAEGQGPYRAEDGSDAALTCPAPVPAPDASEDSSPFVEGLHALLSGGDRAPSTRELTDGVGMLLDLLAGQVVEPPAAHVGSGPSGGNGRAVEGSRPTPQVVPEAEVLDAAVALERLERRARGERLRRVGALDARRTWRRYGAGSTAGMLARCSLATYGQLRGDVADAQALQTLPTAAARVRAGDVDPRHLRSVAEVLRQLEADPELADDPAALAEDHADLDALVAAEAPGSSVAALRRQLTDWQARRGRPSENERKRRAHEHRWLSLSAPSGPLELSRLSGELDPVTAAQLRTYLDGFGGRESADDERTQGQRHLDALAEAVRRRLDGAAGGVGDGPSSDLSAARGRGHAHMILITSPEALDGVEGALASELVGHGPVGSATARELACNADVTEIGWRADGMLNVGRRRRTPTRRLRAAVIARDRRCVGCGAPATRSEIHHVRWWRHGGPTDLENLTLLCVACHQLVHQDGWRVVAHGHGFRLEAPPDHPVAAARARGGAEAAVGQAHPGAGATGERR